MHPWFVWFRRPSPARRRRPRPAWRRRCYRPNLDVLEDRCLLAAPTVDPIQVPLNVPASKTLIVPVTASDPTPGGTVNISLAPTNGATGITVTPLTGTFLEINVSHTSSGSGDPAFTGTLEFELFGTVTPHTVAYITGLVESGFYNGLTFHRVAPDFVIQGGDPNGTGTGGPPGAGATQAQIDQLQYPDEFDPGTIFSGKGQLAMANSGNDTNGSQFFVTDGPQRGLDFNHTIFGQLVRGFDVLAEIEAVPTDSNSKPLAPVTITSAQFVQDPNAAVFLLQSTSSVTGSVPLTLTATSSAGGTTTLPEQANVIADTTVDPPILDVSQAPLNFGQAPGGAVHDLTTAEGAPVSFTLSSTDLQPNTAVTYSVTETDSAQNATVTVDQATGQVTIAPNPGFTGLLTFQASVTSSGSTRNNGPDAQVFTVAVGAQPITAGAAAGGFSATEGAAATGTVATFTDSDTNLTPADFQVQINWGDGTPLDTTGTVTGGGGLFSVDGTHTYARPGQYAIQVSVSQTLTASTQSGTTTTQDAMAQATTTATVNDAALSVQPVAVNAQAGAVFSGPVATFTDADAGAQASDFSATINWGDGTTPSAGTVQAASGGFQVVGSHTYASDGTFSPTVKVTQVNPAGTLDPAPAAGTATDTATITAAAATTLTAQSVAVNGTAGTPLSGVALATFTDTAAGATAGNYTVTIDWDDTTPLDTATGSVVDLGGGKFQVVGSHTYSSQGTFTPAVTIVSSNSGSSPGTLSVDTTATTGPGTASPSATGASGQGYVTQLFRDLTGQAPTAQQLNQFSGELAQGTSRLAVVQQVQSLAQARTLEVQLVYQDLFGTGPTAQQLSKGVSLLAGNHDDVGALRVRLLTSDQFFTTLGGGTSTGYVNALGQVLVHGSLDAATQSRLSAQLDAGTSRLKVLQDLVKTDRQQVEQAGVQNLYQEFLHRAPTAAEVSAQLPLLAQGKENQVVASLVSSDDYFNKAQPSSSTAVTSSANPSSFGQSVTFTATVTPAAGASGTPTGTVTFFDTTSGTVLGTGTLDATGTATLATSALGVGSHTITAPYGGDATFGAGSGTVTQTVNAAASATAVTSSAGTSSSGQSVTFTATVTASGAGSGTPTGTVTFTDSTSGTTLGTATLDTTGKATFSTTGLGVGTHTIAASYGGSGNFTASSGTVSQTVTT
jgi:cyclophilin family peptidyl-prolyl cis-trans isomerase